MDCRIIYGEYLPVYVGCKGKTLLQRIKDWWKLLWWVDNGPPPLIDWIPLIKSWPLLEVEPIEEIK
jgi:hypothetical protein